MNGPQEKSRQIALAMLGFIVRKQPSWLYKITQHSLMKEVLKVLKHEEDLGVLMTALMDILVLIPIVPVYISPYLQDLFEIFSRVASWRYVELQMCTYYQKTVYELGIACFLIPKCKGGQLISFITSLKISNMMGTTILEPVCCKKRPEIVPDQLLVWGIRAL